MAVDAKTLAASKKYTKETVDGAGAIKGKNCTIDSITPITGGNRVTFKWTLDSGTVQTGTMDVMDGADGTQGPQGIQGPIGPAGADGANGLGIASVDIRSTDNHLIITYTDGTTHDAGEIPSGGGTGDVTSVNGKKGVVILYATDIKLTNDPSAQTIKLTIDQLAGSLANKANASDIPTKTSELTNDSNYISDASYVHTDNNYTSADKAIVTQIPLDMAQLQGSLANKVDKVAGKGLSTNDYIDADKNKLGDLANIKSIGTGLSLNPTTGELEATGAAITIDPALDPTSAHAIQNQAVAIPIAALQGSVLGIKSTLNNKADKTELPTKTSDLTNDSNYISDASYVHTDNNYTAADKAIVTQVPLDISALQASMSLKADSANVPTKTSDLTNDSNFVSDASYVHTNNNYTDADKAIVTQVPLDIAALQGSMSLKANASDIPTKTSELTNDSNFVSDASYVHTDNNYTSADKTALQTTIPLDISQLQASLLTKAPQATTYTKTEVDQLIGAVSSLNFEVVTALPTSNISTSTIYLVPNSSAGVNNYYDEYLNLDGTTAGWELIGSTQVDLSNYIQKNLTAGLVKNDGTIDTNTYLTTHQDITGKADKVTSATNGNFAGLDSNGNITDSGKKASDFVTDVSDKADKVTSATNGNFAGLDSNGNLTDSGKKPSDFLTSHQDITGKADKVTSATNGNFAGLDSNGNLVDSGKKPSDFLTSHQSLANYYATTDTAETNLDDADSVPFYDNSATAKRRSTWSNIKAKLKAYFDTLYTAGSIQPTPSASITDTALKNAINGAGSSESKIASAYAVRKWSNALTKRYIVSGSTHITATGIGTWDDDDPPTETDWITISDLVGIESHDEIDVSIKYDPSFNEPILLGGYIIDTSTGKMCIKFANEIATPANAKIAIDITFLRNESSNAVS